MKVCPVKERKATIIAIFGSILLAIAIGTALQYIWSGIGASSPLKPNAQQSNQKERAADLKAPHSTLGQNQSQTMESKG
jgi:hypothetical protein